MTRIEVKDFGPIAEGAVDLKPLTVFIGPNNSGKSYMALLVYALSRVGAVYDIYDIPDLAAGEGKPSRSSLLRDELRRCFGASIQELARRGGGPGPEGFSVAVRRPELPQWEVRSRDDDLEQAEWEDAIDRFNREAEQKGRTVTIPVSDLPQLILGGINLSHYLPASRTGILLGHKTLSSLIVGQASLAWVRPIEIPRLTGDITDLIQNILLLESSHKPGGDIRPVVDFLEKEITGGRVDVDWRAEYPEIYFEDDTGRYRLNQVSSTVSEMAPLVLYLKYVVEPGERVIIEEPESHLDAGNQRHLASAIARLVNAGVNVLVTTHSDYLLSELNNLLLASGVDADYTKDYDANELLAPEQVGAYLFNPVDGGTRVEEMGVTREDGILAESFAKVHEALYDEAIRLQYAGT